MNRSGWKTVRWDEQMEVSNGIEFRGSYSFKGTPRTFHFAVTEGPDALLQVTSSAPEECAIALDIHFDKPTPFFGAGAQFTHVNLAGRRFSILAQEPGIGRGIQPLTWFMNRVAGAGGSDVQSSCPSNQFTTAAGWAWVGDNLEPSFLDFSSPGRATVEVESNSLSGTLVVGQTPKDITEGVTNIVGRMPPLPSWTQNGALIGLQGGSELVNKRVQAITSKHIPIAGLWLQDWVGQRKTSVGKQLWWNWERDREHYPTWNDFEQQGYRVLSYFNPFLIDPTEKPSFSRNFLEEAREKGLLVKKEDGTPYPVQNTSFFAELLDFSNPEAVKWFQTLIAEHLENDRVSGWMADFAEALPFDAALNGADDAVAYHNAYPVEWARANRTAIAKAGREDDVFFFSRSGHTRSPGVGRCFWLGDQLTSWHKEDGIHSALAGILSGGFSGFSISHSDIGGYTTTAVPGMPPILPGLVYRRSAELLMRWAELNAFTCLFRSHEGNQPSKNVQLWDSDTLMEHFGFFARIFAALAPYRTALFDEASKRGYPLVRHSYFVFPEDLDLANEDKQFFLGDDLLVAPVLEKGQDVKRVRFPAGTWASLWDPSEKFHTSTGATRMCSAPIGSPSVWFNQDSSHVTLFQRIGEIPRTLS